MVKTWFPSLLLALSAPWAVLAGNPVIVGLPVSGTVPNVDPVIPAGKALVLPLSAHNDQREPITFTVTSSNPHIFARVRSGSPLLKFTILHNGNGTSTGTDPMYTGDLVFQLFRNYAPKASDYIGGFAQGGFYDQYTDHPGLTFHRIADLANSDATQPTAPHNYIYQGGDPSGDGSGGPGFDFDNEFSPALIFAGRGQLAMANAGYDSTTRKGTNGSQFFITDSQPRFLDYNHTIFGQLEQGWDLLEKLKNTAVTDEKPNDPVTITKAEVLYQYDDGTNLNTDAVLLLSSSVIGTAQVTVTATDPRGNHSTQSFLVNAARDTNNSPPFIMPLENRVGLPAKLVTIPFRVVDLERDFVSVGQTLLSNNNGVSVKAQSAVSGNLFGILGNPSYQSTAGGAGLPYQGPVVGALSVTQFDPSRRAADGNRGVDDYQVVTVALGEKDFVPQPVQFVGAPTTELGNVVVARFRDTDPQGSAANFTATINWGDGMSVADAATVAVDGSQGAFGGYQVLGDHTYLRDGTYTVVVTVNGSLGLTREIRSTAIITQATLSVSAQNLTLAGPRFLNREVARITDAGTPGVSADYAASIDWGDGLLSPGTVRALGNGVFAVYASHAFRDPETYAYSVHVHRAGQAVTQDPTAWGRIVVSGFAGQAYLPPFNQPHLVAEITPVPTDHNNSSSAEKPTKETVGDPATGPSQTFLSYTLVILNTGNLPSKAGTLLMLLSPDTTPNPQPVKDAGGNIVTPADAALEWGPPLTAGGTVRRKVVAFPALKPGEARQFYFEKSSLGDYRLRLPANETGSGENLLGYFQSANYLTSIQPIDKSAAVGPIQGIYVSPQLVNTSETGTTGTFTVHLDKRPAADVTIPITVGDSTEGSVDKSSLTFTPANWTIPQIVTVTGKADSVLPTTATPNPTSAVDGTVTYTVTLGAATSDDPLYSGMNVPDVTVTNADIDGNIDVETPNQQNTLSTTEAAGTSNTATFTLQLRRRPTSNVTVQVFLSDTTESQIILPGQTSAVTVGQAINYTFDLNDPDLLKPKTFTVVGLDDGANDGDITYTISFQATSADPMFNNITPKIITAKNLDAE